MQKDRKREHKKVIKYIRKLNKNISEDAYLGLNRFRIDSYRENWYRYEDGSGGDLNCFVKITDTLTNNCAVFIVNNYDYYYKIIEYTNDFMIRCSSGNYGHYPALHYVMYDIHEIVSYDGNKVNNYTEKGVIGKYDFISH